MTIEIQKKAGNLPNFRLTHLVYQRRSRHSAKTLADCQWAKKEKTMEPTIPQIKHFWKLVDEGKITSANLQAYMENTGRFLTGLLTTYDQSLGLTELICRAVGPDNLGNINSDITQARFPLQGTGVRTVNLRVEPFLDNETGEQAAQRLTAAGHILADTGDLAGFTHDHPQEVAKFTWVVALAKTARWSSPDGCVFVPYAIVLGSDRYFFLDYFRDQFDSAFGVLVRCE